MSDIYTLPNGRVTPDVLEAYMAWKSQANKLKAKLEAMERIVVAVRAFLKALAAAQEEDKK